MNDNEQLPKTIGRYEIKRLLGAGAMGSVYLAEDPRIKRKLAIKVVRMDAIRSEADRQEFLARFQREAEVSGVLNDPGIVTIYDVGDSEFGPFLAMEFVPGRPLDAFVKGGEVAAMPLARKLQIAAHVAAALDHAHSHGIVHRDVKPGNVMITEEGRAKLMDFGIAKREDATLTQTGTFLGTPSYASPEQIREGTATDRSDVFSFGVMVFELLSGVLPFQGSSINTILYRIVNEPPVDIQPPVLGLLPEGWQRIFGRALAKAPEERYPTCGAFVRDLLDAATELDKNLRMELLGTLRQGGAAAIPPLLSRAHEETMYLPPEKARRGRKLGLVLAAGGLLALAGGGFWLFSGRTARVLLVSEPAGAKVLQDGQERGTTPWLGTLATGETVVLERPGFEALSYTHRGGAEAPLLRLKGRVTEELLATEPAGATVVFDGQNLGQPTPAKVSWDQGKRHTLSFTKGELGLPAMDFREGETPGGQTFRLVSEAAATALDPNAPGGLRLAGTYAVRVKAGGKDLGELRPGGHLPLGPGEHQLELSAPEVFYHASRGVRVDPGQVVTLAVPATAQVTLSTFPGSGILTVDGRPTGVESTGEASVRVARGVHVFGVQGRSGSKRIDVQGDLTDKFAIR